MWLAIHTGTWVDVGLVLTLGLSRKKKIWIIASWIWLASPCVQSGQLGMYSDQDRPRHIPHTKHVRKKLGYASSFPVDLFFYWMSQWKWTGFTRRFQNEKYRQLPLEPSNGVCAKFVRRKLKNMSMPVNVSRPGNLLAREAVSMSQADVPLWEAFNLCGCCFPQGFIMKELVYIWL